MVTVDPTCTSPLLSSPSLTGAAAALGFFGAGIGAGGQSRRGKCGGTGWYQPPRTQPLLFSSPPPPPSPSMWQHVIPFHLLSPSRPVPLLSFTDGCCVAAQVASVGGESIVGTGAGRSPVIRCRPARFLFLSELLFPALPRPFFIPFLVMPPLPCPPRHVLLCHVAPKQPARDPHLSFSI